MKTLSAALGLLIALQSNFAFSQEAEFEGTIDREQVRQTVRSRLKDISECQKKELQSGQNVEGKVVLEIEINDSGAVKNTRVRSSTLNNDKIQECMVQIVKGLTFPKPPKGTIAVVNYPFDFKLKK